MQCEIFIPRCPIFVIFAEFGLRLISTVCNHSLSTCIPGSTVHAGLSFFFSLVYVPVAVDTQRILKYVAKSNPIFVIFAESRPSQIISCSTVVRDKHGLWQQYIVGIG